MSARDPYISSPASPRIIAWSHPEDVIAACLEQGLSAKLHEPDLGKSPQFEVVATGDQMRALGKWGVRYYHGGERAYEEAKARNKERSRLQSVASALRGTPQYQTAFETALRFDGATDEHISNIRTLTAAGHGTQEYQAILDAIRWKPAPRPPEGWGNSEYAHFTGYQCRKFRCYQLSELVFDTALAHGLRAERVTFPDEDYVIAWIWAEEKDFRRAQYDWLQQMIAAMPKHKPASMELDIFA